MSYQKILQRASFRGIKFHVQSSERTIGFNYKVHVFPGTDRKALPEEISEQPQILPVESFLIGPDAAYTRDLLIAACRKRTPGKLQHPQIGFIDAKCRSFQIRETFDKVGKISVYMEFLEVEKSDDYLFPDIGVMDALKAADQALTDAMLGFNEVFSVLDMPAYAIASVSSMLNKLANFVTSGNGLGRIPDTLTDLRDAVESLGSEAKNLLHSPLKLLENITTAVNYLSGQDVVSVHNAFKNELLTLDEGAEPVTKVREASNRNAVAEFIMTACLVSASEKLLESVSSEVNQPLVSTRETVGDRVRIVKMAESQMELADDRLFNSLRSLAAVLTVVVPGKTQLPATHFLAIPEPQPALILAYDRYGDIRLEEDIIQRNSVVYPGEVSGEIEVVANV